MNWDVLLGKIQGGLFLQGAQGYCSVHHGEVKEMVLMQSSACPFPNKQGLGFSMAHTNSQSDELGFDAFETLCLNA